MTSRFDKTQFLQDLDPNPSEQATYTVRQFDGDAFMFTFYGSDADTQRKGWRSIGCHSVRGVAQRDLEIAAIERAGHFRPTA